MFKKQTGITLVALVITIIVLLILAGVSISLVVGNNGVLTQASNSVIKTKAAEAKSALELALGTAEAEYYAQWTDNSKITRNDVYDTQGVVIRELANQGYTTAAGFVPDAESSSESTVTLTKNGETYTLTASVDGATGNVTIGSTITIGSETVTL